METSMAQLQNDYRAERASKQQSPFHVSCLRYERKFSIRAFDRRQLETLVKTNPALFRECYSPRYVNNIYLDTPNKACYLENLSGIASRTKVRIRWYGDLPGHIERPVLEFKIKNGLAGRKISYPLAPFRLDRRFNLETLRTVWLNSDLPGSIYTVLRTLEPALLNRYQRSYFESADQLFRITIDDQLSFWRIDAFSNAFLHHFVDREHHVIELKYGIDEEAQAHTISRHFPFRITRCSKYTTGISRIYGGEI
jgi:SPX domain protein involved in polyphosphate accumulation